MLIILGRIPKPNREALLRWIRMALNQLELEDGLFVSTILRDADSLARREVPETEENDNLEIDTQELVSHEEEYDFEELE